MSHTPGPWRIDETDPGMFEVYGPSNGFCADIIVSGRFDNAYDATLTAAAPELLEACTSFLERFDGQSRADTDYVAGLMRKAVAKARQSHGGLDHG